MTETDVMSLDPYLFCFGFFLIAVGISLSQVHRDEGILLPMWKGLAFNSLRKISGIEILAGSILGFWVVGTWWLLWLPLVWLVSCVPVYFLKAANNRLSILTLAMLSGLVIIFWAQGPTLIELGLLPRL
jgi:hypothetical protein